jgi:hypothetical protein
MVKGCGIRRWRRFTAFAFALYVVFLVTAPFEHHDLVCHLKTPLHCASCTSSPLGADPYAPQVPTGGRLADAGRPVSFQPLPDSVLLDNTSSGRSPPSFS